MSVFGQVVIEEINALQGSVTVLLDLSADDGLPITLSLEDGILPISYSFDAITNTSSIQVSTYATLNELNLMVLPETTSLEVGRSR